MDIVGLHGRNDIFWPESDYEAIAYIRPSWLKMMSHTDPSVFERVLATVPECRFITRLYVGGFGTGRTHPNAAEFAANAIEHITRLLDYCTYFEIHNEPNHAGGVEGWGATEGDARNFCVWYQLVFNILRSRFPTIKLGFPGLALPHFIHQDRMWLEICHPAIEMSHWLGCHSYWQSPPGDETEYWRHPDFGLNCQFYHSLYSHKDIYITEAGNSNCQGGDPKKGGYPLDEDTRAWQYGAWFRRLAEFEYIKAACPFILSSPDKTWDGFCLLNQDGSFRPAVHTLANLKGIS